MNKTEERKRRFNDCALCGKPVKEIVRYRKGVYHKECAKFAFNEEMNKELKKHGKRRN